jgi:fructose-1,6-bisphosphatase/inositol monophosphatase family enzyme
LAFDLAERAEFIRIARHVARTEVMPRFRQLDPGQISTKSGPQDLVTEADLACEAALTRAFALAFPTAFVIGEEAVSAGTVSLDALPGQARVIVIDPIDGTWPFARGQCGFGMILSVIEAGEVVFGLHLDPVMDDWIWAAPGEGAHWARDGGTRRLACGPDRPLSERVGFLPLGLFPKSDQHKLAALMPEFSRVLSLRCSAHEYRMLAEGGVDFCLSGNLNVWDHAAGALIVTEAGGKVAMLDGSPYRPELRQGALLSANSAATWAELADMVSFLR